LRDVLILLSNSYSYSFYTCLLRQDYRICRIYRIFDFIILLILIIL